MPGRSTGCAAHHTFSVLQEVLSELPPAFQLGKHQGKNQADRLSWEYFHQAGLFPLHTHRSRHSKGHRRRAAGCDSHHISPRGDRGFTWGFVTPNCYSGAETGCGIMTSFSSGSAESNTRPIAVAHLYPSQQTQREDGLQPQPSHKQFSLKPPKPCRSLWSHLVPSRPLPFHELLPGKENKAQLHTCNSKKG